MLKVFTFDVLFVVFLLRTFGKLLFLQVLSVPVLAFLLCTAYRQRCARTVVFLLLEMLPLLCLLLDLFDDFIIEDNPVDNDLSRFHLAFYFLSDVYIEGFVVFHVHDVSTVSIY